MHKQLHQLQLAKSQLSELQIKMQTIISDLKQLIIDKLKCVDTYFFNVNIL